MDLKTARWFPIPERALMHPVQIRLKRDLETLKHSEYIIPAGRRSFKTERFIKRKALQLLSQDKNKTFFLGAPTRIQAEGIFWKDIKALCPSWLMKNKSESKLLIESTNGNTLQIVGLKEFKRIQGQLCHGVLLSEYQECDVDVWTETFQPMLNDTNGIAIKEGRPFGKNHFYDDYLRGMDSNETRVGSYHWTSEEILSEQQIINAKKDLGKADYEREYLASFETGSSNPYYAYSHLNHSSYDLNTEYMPVIICCDFNATEKPMSWNIGQRLTENTEDVTHWTKSFQYQYTNTQTMCEIVDEYFQDTFAEEYPKHLIFYGDYSGKAEKSNSSYSDWTIIEKFFSNKCHTFEKNIKPCKSIRNSIASTNAQLCNTNNQRKQFVNPEECRPLITDWTKTEYKANGRELDESNDMYGHSCRAVDYYNDYEHPVKELAEAEWTN